MRKVAGLGGEISGGVLRTRMWLCAGAALLLIVGGCTVDARKERSIYRAVVDTDQPTTQPAYQAGQPVSLHDALVLSNALNERIDFEGENYLQSILDRDRAFSAFIPTISLAPSFSYVDRSGVTNATGRNPVTNVPVRTGYSNFSPVREISNFERSQSVIQQRRALLLNAKATLLLDVAQTYYQVLRSERTVDVLVNSSEVQEARVRDARARQRAGVARPLDAAQAEAQAASTRAQLVDARRDVRTGRQTLAFLLNAAVENAPLTDEYAIPLPLPTVVDLARRAQAGRQEIIAAQAGIEAARQAVSSAASQYYPNISINFDYFLSRQSIPTAQDWLLLLQVEVPIFAAGRIHAEVRIAWSQLRQAMLDAQLVQRQVKQEVENAYATLVATDQRIAELRTQLAAAEEALRLAEQSYQAGLATNLDRLTAQDQLLVAQLSLVSSQFDQKVFYLNLLRAVGDLGVGPGALGTDLPKPPEPPGISTPFP